MKRLLLAGLMVLGMMAAPVKVMGQSTSNLLPDEYTAEGYVTRGYASEGYKGVKWRFYPNTLTSENDGVTFLSRHTLRLQSYSDKYTVTLGWSETSYTTQSYNIEAETQRAVMTYYESSDNMISTIATGAFRNFTNLESVELPQNVNGVTIGTNAFYGCANLQTAYNMEYAYTVNPGAFKDTPLRNSRNAIGEARLFSIGSSCNSTLTSGVINGSAFKNTKLSRVHIGNNIATIGQSAFEGCSSMTELTIGDNVTSIGAAAFRGCTGLTSISLGAGFNLNIDIPNVFDDPMNLNTISISDENIAYSDEGNCLVDANDVLWIGTNSSVIPDRVTTIGEKAFYGRTGLTSIVIPAGVTEIGEEAFAYCENLKMVTCMSEEPFSFSETTFEAIPYDAVLMVPSEAAKTAYEAANYLDYFGSIIVGKSGVVTNGVNWVLYPNDNGYTLEISGKGAMADYEYESAVPWSKYNVGEDIFNKINKVVVKEGITHIGKLCFARLGYYLGMDGAIDVEVSLPDNLKSVATEAFTYSYGLKSLEMPNSVEAIGNRTFYGCHNLSRIEHRYSQSFWTNHVYDIKDNCIINIEYDRNLVIYGCYNATIPEGVKSIGGQAFAGQKRLKSITIPSSVKAIYGYDEELGAFSYSALESITFAEGSQLTTIEPYAFFYCESLKSIDLPNSLTTIGEGAFLECYALESVKLGSSVETIGASAFNCAPISSITIPASVKSIGNRAFYDCGLEHVTLHCANVDNWFSGYATIKEVVVGEGVTSIVDDAFSGCSIERVTFNCANIGGWFSGTTTLKEVVLSESVTSIGDDAFYSCNALGSIAIPASVKSIGSRAFSESKKLKSVTFAEGSQLTSIGDNAFNYCNALGNIDLPNSLTTIGEGAFLLCEAFTSITIPNSVTTVGAKAFHYCTKLESATLSNSMEAIPDNMFYNCVLLKEITIPESVTSIGEYAFYNCASLKNITIGQSVESIGAWAFSAIPQAATITWLAYDMPTLGYQAFTTNNTTWRVYYIPNYSSSNSTTTIEAIPVTITDGAVDNYEDFFEEDILLSRMEYNRTLLADSKWNALYVPFEIPVADIIDKYDVAYINDVRLYDSDNDGEIDDNGMEVEVVPVKSGTLNANTPCLIRVKKSLSAEDAAAARSMNLALETKLCPAEERTFDCSSLYKTFAFTGIYSKRVKDVDDDFTGAYAIATDGNWHPSPSLKPFRIFLHVTNRDGTPYQPTSAAAIRIRMVGEEETTGIENLEPAGNGQQSTVIYDLAGRRVETPTKGIYIVDGKKTVIK